MRRKKKELTKTRKKGAASIRCIDLFCGAGGLTHGFELEGLPVAAGIDLDPACRFPYEVNNEATFVERSVTQLTARHLNRYFGSADVRVLAGCAPCQPFSTYTQGKNTKNDQKWGLLYEFRRLARSTRPEIITMENVPSARRHSVFSDFVETLRALKYDIWHDVLECAEYGVPQLRQRLVLLASRLGSIEMIQGSRRKPKTVKQAIGRLMPIQAGSQSSRDRLHASSSLSELNLQRIRASEPGGSWRDWPKSLVADCHKSDRGKSYPAVYGRMGQAVTNDYHAMLRFWERSFRPS